MTHIHDKGGEMTARGMTIPQVAVRKDPIAYVVTPTPHADYSPAHVFVGKIEVIGGPVLSPNAESSWHTGAIHHIRRILSNYIPGFDYIIPTGQPARMMLVGMVLMEKGKRHQLLGWDTRTGRYVKYDLNLNN